MTEETIIEGTYLGERTKTTFNPKTQKVEQFITPIKVFIERANIVGQYIVKRTNLSTGHILYLLCFVKKNSLMSTSAGGLDDILFGCDNIVHSWSIPADCDGTLINARTVLTSEHHY
jgi:hypothetical protein